MPLSYTIDVPNRIVYGRGQGEVTEADVVNIREQLGTDPQFSPRSLSGIRSLQPRINNLQTGDGS